MHTVYIKVAFKSQFVNVDLIESIWYNPEDNKIYLNGTPEKDPFNIYAGKAVNGEDAILKIMNLIHEAKVMSSERRTAIILDFSTDVDNYEASEIERSPLQGKFQTFY